MSRKSRTDSTVEMLRIAEGAEKQIAPPSHVRMGDNDWPFWHSVVAEYARADWTEHQLECAAVLARSMADLELNQWLLRQEGTVVEREILDGKGEVKKIISFPNARAGMVQALMSQVLSMRRSLALHARAKSGSNADAAKQRDANKTTEKKVKSKDHLLA